MYLTVLFLCVVVGGVLYLTSLLNFNQKKKKRDPSSYHSCYWSKIQKLELKFLQTVVQIFETKQDLNFSFWISLFSYVAPEPKKERKKDKTHK